MNIVVNIPPVYWPVFLSVLVGLTAGFLWGYMRAETKTAKHVHELRTNALEWANAIVAESEHWDAHQRLRWGYRLDQAKRVLSGEEWSVCL